MRLSGYPTTASRSVAGCLEDDFSGVVIVSSEGADGGHRLPMLEQCRLWQGAEVGCSRDEPRCEHAHQASLHPGNLLLPTVCCAASRSTSWLV